MSELVHDAARTIEAADADDLAALSDRKRKPTVALEEAMRSLTQRGTIGIKLKSRH